MLIDYISDVHLDRSFGFDQKIPKEVLYSLLPEKPGEILIFAGDFGECISQNVFFLSFFSNFYSAIFFTFGNNDITLAVHEKEHYQTAKEKVVFFQKQIENIPNIYFLDGSSLFYKNIKIGGSSHFFDFEVLEKHHHLSKSEFLNLWNLKKMNKKHSGIMYDPFLYLNQKKEELYSLMDCDILLSHGPPDYFYKADSNPGFYCFNGDDFLPFLNNKIWFYGHKHVPSRKIFQNGLFLNNAVGYINKHSSIKQINVYN